MSARLMIAVMRGAFGLTPAQKLVLIALAEHARQNAEAWPSVSTLAYFGCLKRRQVQVILRALVAADWLKLVRPSKGGRGPAGTAHYKLNLARMSEVRPANSALECTVAAPANSALECTVAGAPKCAVNAIQVRSKRQTSAHSSAHEPVKNLLLKRTCGRAGESTQSVSDFEKSKTDSLKKDSKSKPEPPKNDGGTYALTDAETAARRAFLDEQIQSIKKAVGNAA
jgi:hypothetical protein